MDIWLLFGNVHLLYVLWKMHMFGKAHKQLLIINNREGNFDQDTS